MTWKIGQRRKARYQKRPESDTHLKPHELARAGWYDVTMVVEVTRRLRIKALDEAQATLFAENRVRKKSKGLASQYDAVIGDIHFISVEEEQDESTD